MISPSDFKNHHLRRGSLGDKYHQVISPNSPSPPIVSIEDPLDQDDWDGYVHFTERVGKEYKLEYKSTRIQTGIDKKERVHYGAYD